MRREHSIHVCCVESFFAVRIYSEARTADAWRVAVGGECGEVESAVKTHIRTMPQSPPPLPPKNIIIVPISKPFQTLLVSPSVRNLYSLRGHQEGHESSSNYARHALRKTRLERAHAKSRLCVWERRILFEVCHPPPSHCSAGTGSTAKAPLPSHIFHCSCQESGLDDFSGSEVQCPAL